MRVRHAERVSAGTPLPVVLTLTGDGRRPQLDLSVAAWGLPLAVDALSEEGTPVGTLASGESRTVILELLCRKRGVYALPGWRVQSDFPFGLLNAYRVVREGSRVIVHPAFHPLESLALPTGRRWQPGGILAAAKAGDSFEYAGNRSFREGDRLRDIDWRATARHVGAEGGGLVVREWREEFFLRVGVILDTHVPPGTDKKQRDARLGALERAVSVCAAIGSALAERDYMVDLFAAGPKLLHLTAGRGPGYREQILDELALVEPSAEEPLSLIAPRLAEDLESLTTVICVLLGWDAPRQTFVDEIRAQGVGVRVVLIAETDADAPPQPDPDMRIVTPSAVIMGGVGI